MNQPKIWKRGDKLTIKELNRIESMVANSNIGQQDNTPANNENTSETSGPIYVTCDCVFDENLSEDSKIQQYEVSNFSMELEEVFGLVDDGKEIIIKAGTIFEGDDDMPVDILLYPSLLVSQVGGLFCGTFSMDSSIGFMQMAFSKDSDNYETLAFTREIFELPSFDEISDQEKILTIDYHGDPVWVAKDTVCGRLIAINESNGSYFSCINDRSDVIKISTLLNALRNNKLVNLIAYLNDDAKPRVMQVSRFSSAQDSESKIILENYETVTSPNTEIKITQIIGTAGLTDSDPDIWSQASTIIIASSNG